MEKEKLSPKQYLLRHRLRMAVEMLCTTSYSITEIALSCGFHDASSFSGCFRKEFHRLPQRLPQNARMVPTGWFLPFLQTKKFPARCFHSTDGDIFYFTI